MTTGGLFWQLEAPEKFTKFNACKTPSVQIIRNVQDVQSVECSGEASLSGFDYCGEAGKISDLMTTGTAPED